MLSPSPCSAMSRRVDFSRAGTSSVVSCSIPGRLLRMARVVVPLQHVIAEIIFKAAINRVDVIGVVLRVVVFNQERRPLHAIIVRLTTFRSAAPCEEKFAWADGANFFQIGARSVFTVTIGVFLDEFPRNFLLVA